VESNKLHTVENAYYHAKVDSLLFNNVY
jgi:hypothetical protein